MLKTKARDLVTRGAAQAAMPKQYMSLRGQPIATHSLDVFARMPEVGQIVVVCEAAYRSVLLPNEPWLIVTADRLCLAGISLRTTGGKS